MLISTLTIKRVKVLRSRYKITLLNFIIQNSLTASLIGAILAILFVIAELRPIDTEHLAIWRSFGTEELVSRADSARA